MENGSGVYSVEGTTKVRHKLYRGKGRAQGEERSLALFRSDLTVLAQGGDIAEVLG
jgi:hypothetical protein